MVFGYLGSWCDTHFVNFPYLCALTYIAVSKRMHIDDSFDGMLYPSDGSTIGHVSWDGMVFLCCICMVKDAHMHMCTLGGT